MNFTTHPSNNDKLGAPIGWDHSSIPCGILPITRLDGQDGVPSMVSFWKPEPAELAALNKGASVMLSVYGRAHPPVALMVSEPEEAAPVLPREAALVGTAHDAESLEQGEAA